MSTNPVSHNARKAKPEAHIDVKKTSKSGFEIAPLERMVEPNDRLMMIHDPYDPRCEKMRALQTELLLRRESIDRADIVAVLSPCAGEGRSLLAAELAIAFAQTGRSTLLVDADLRRPQQHLFFNTDNRPGLSEAIENGINPPFHSVRKLPHMRVLTAGASPGNTLELLSSRRFASMIEDWRDQFEFVVLDTAPVMHFSDGLAVANLVGRVLALSRAQHTPYRDMQEMLRRLAATHSHFLGAVINHF